MVHRCSHCDAELETRFEIVNGLCEGCCIDLYEEQQRTREQAWLEDDRNWND